MAPCWRNNISHRAWLAFFASPVHDPLVCQCGPVWAGYAFYYGYRLEGHGYVLLGNVMLIIFAIFVLAAFRTALRPHQVYTYAELG